MADLDDDLDTQGSSGEVSHSRDSVSLEVTSGLALNLTLCYWFHFILLPLLSQEMKSSRGFSSSHSPLQVHRDVSFSHVSFSLSLSLSLSLCLLRFLLSSFPLLLSQPPTPHSSLTRAERWASKHS